MGAHGNLKKTTAEQQKALNKAVHEGDAAIKAAQKEAATVTKELQQLQKEKSTVESALAAEFVMLRDGSSRSAEGKKAVQKLRTLGNQYGLDKTLLGVLPTASEKKPEARTEFEALSFTNLHDLMTRVVNDLAQKVSQAEPGVAAKAQAVAAAEAAKTAAVTSAKDAHEAAKGATKAA